MKKILVILMCTFAVHVQAQEGVAINNDGASPDASSILDLKSTTKGILIPRMTESQRTQISNVATGLLVFQTDGASGFYFYSGSGWESLSTKSNTLDEAYDEGGAGSGRIITADAGTVVINGTGGLLVDANTTTLSNAAQINNTDGTNSTETYIGKVGVLSNEVVVQGVYGEAKLTSATQIYDGGFGVFGTVKHPSNGTVNLNATAASAGASVNKAVGVGGEIGPFSDYIGGPADIIASVYGGTALHNSNGGSVYGGAKLYAGLFQGNGRTIGLWGENSTYMELIPRWQLQDYDAGVIGFYNSDPDGGNNDSDVGTSDDYLSIEANVTDGTVKHVVLQNRTSGNVAIGHSFPIFKLDVNGEIYTDEHMMALGGIHVGGTADPGTDNLVVDGNTTVVGTLTTGTVTYPNTDGLAGQVMTTNGAGVVSFQTPNTSAAAWELTGNAGTTNGTDFIGTTDAQDLDIRTNNVVRARITQKGQIETLNTGNSVFIGEGAGANDDLSDNYNVFVGKDAGASNTTGLVNTAIGSSALELNTTGYYNTANGNQALWSNTSGSSNTANGNYALRYNTTGYSNTANGNGALYSNTTGWNNTANGKNALRSNTTGYSNVAMGVHALYANTDRSNLVAIGDSALYNNGVGATVALHASENTAVGSKALYDNNIGYQNTAVGFEALNSNAAGYYNTAVGRRALYNSTGWMNSAFGTDALYNNQSHANTAIGGAALFTNISGVGNVAVGLQSLSYSLGSANIGLGYQAGDNLTTGDNNIFIGYDIDAPVATGSNQMSIGNLIYATGVDGTGTTVSSGNVGIGDASPDGKLEVRQTAAADIFNLYDNTTNVLSVQDGGNFWADATTTFFVQASTNEVGIGDASPDGKLEVRQTGTDDIFNLYDNTTNVFTVEDGGDVGIGDATPDGKLEVRQTAADDLFNLYDNTTNVFTVIDGGNVGIGDVAPSQQVEIKGGTATWDLAGNAVDVDNVYLEDLTAADGVDAIGGSISFSGAGNGGGGAARRHAAIAGVQTSAENDHVGLAFFTHNSSTSTADMQESMRITHDGNTGIGNTAPGYKLDVSGDMNITGDYRINGVVQSFSDAQDLSLAGNTLSLTNDATTVDLSGYLDNTDAQDLSLAGNTLSLTNDATTVDLSTYLDNTDDWSNSGSDISFSTGNVGIGISTPTQKLHVQGTDPDITGVSGVFVNISNSATGTDGTMSGIRFSNYIGTTSNKGAMFYQRNQGYGIGDIHFAINSALNSTDVTKADAIMTIRSTGDVGIGTTAPSEKLQVAGNVYSSSGDFYAAVSNGVINCGGGIMTANLNYIGDSYAAPSNVSGDEDLYIQDDLQVGGAAYKPGGGSWTAASDKRLKNNIVSFNDGLEELVKVKPVKFNYNDKSGFTDLDKQYIGVIAQDLIEVAPYMVEESNFWQEVVEDENGVERIVKEGEKFYTVDPSAFTYILINSVQEQQIIIESQKAEIDELKAQVKAIQQSLQTMSSK